jgi:hypothetical protein
VSDANATAFSVDEKQRTHGMQSRLLASPASFPGRCKWPPEFDDKQAYDYTGAHHHHGSLT